MPAALGGPTYRFVKELASGGMGRVELVVRREGTFARAYARKRPLGDLALDGRVRDMLLEEARVAGLVRNAHVVPVLDVGEDEEGVFLVMEFVDGVALDAVVERLETRLPLQCLVEIGRQIAEGLHAVHEMTTTDGAPMEIVHRDLTPSNVLVGFDGIVRVTDFGIARARDRAAISRPGVRKGKPSYMAPEQLRAEEVDRRTDLFALGVVLGEMTGGGRLHGDVAPAERARRTLEEPPPDIGELRADVPSELVALAFELMARRPEDRPRDARLVATRLAAIRDQLRIEEGSIDLGELVRARFDDRRRDNDRMLAEALRDQDPTVQMEVPGDDTTEVNVPASDLVPLPEPSGELFLGEPSVTEPATTPWKLPAEARTSSARASTRSAAPMDPGSTDRVPREHDRARNERSTYAVLAIAGTVVVVASAATIWWATRERPPSSSMPPVIVTTPVSQPPPGDPAPDPDPLQIAPPDVATATPEVSVEGREREPRAAAPRTMPRTRPSDGTRASHPGSRAEPTTPRAERRTWSWE